MPYLIPEKDAIFVHVPKNAGTSISTWLEQNCREKIIRAKRKHDSFEESVKKYGNFSFSFAVVRNPFERLVSAYFYNKRIFRNRKLVTLEEIKNLSAKKQSKHIRNYKLQESLKYDFDYFIRYNFCHPCLDTQTKLVSGTKHILRYENLQRNFLVIQEYFKTKKPLNLKNKSSHKNYRQYYDTELIDIIFSRYEEDFINFNYDF